MNQFDPPDSPLITSSQSCKGLPPTDSGRVPTTHGSRVSPGPGPEIFSTLEFQTPAGSGSQGSPGLVEPSDDQSVGSLKILDFPPGIPDHIIPWLTQTYTLDPEGHLVLVDPGGGDQEQVGNPHVLLIMEHGLHPLFYEKYRIPGCQGGNGFTTLGVVVPSKTSLTRSVRSHDTSPLVEVI